MFFAGGRSARFERNDRPFRAAAWPKEDVLSWKNHRQSGEPGVGVMSESYRKALLDKKAEILTTGGIRPIAAQMENNSRQGDLADQASGNNEVHIQLKLKQTDAKILQAIEEAIVRIDKGNYGICRDCGEPISPARLNAIPWTRVCITCKEKQNS
jgi:DnaK suppressor protein